VPIVCVNRPNRSEPRHFTPKDVARISRYAAERHTVRNIFVAVIVGLGLGASVCVLARAVNRTLGVVGLIKQLAALLASAAAAKALLNLLQRLTRLPIARTPLIATVLITLYFVINAIVKGAASLASDLETIEDFAGKINDICEAVEIWR